MSLGDRLKEKRKTKKLTQQDVAEKLGINNTTISKWESDTYEPDAENLKKLAELYDVTVDFLLGRNSDESGNQTIRSSAYYGGGEDWTDEEKQAADAFIEMLRKKKREQGEN